jgi:hypothetical protein
MSSLTIVITTEKATQKPTTLPRLSVHHAPRMIEQPVPAFQGDVLRPYPHRLYDGCTANFGLKALRQKLERGALTRREG